MGVLLKLILISVLVYYTIKTVFRLFLPLLGKKFVKEMNKRAYSQSKIKKEGEVTIQINKKDADKIDKNMGEYTDFEEIKE